MITTLNITHFLNVIPAKAGIHFWFVPTGVWIPAFAGMT